MSEDLPRSHGERVWGGAEAHTLSSDLYHPNAAPAGLTARRPPPTCEEAPLVKVGAVITDTWV